LVDFIYLGIIYIQLSIFKFCYDLKLYSFKHTFYRDTAIGRRIAYKKFGTPNSIMWHTYAKRHNINQAYDRVKYFYRKELTDTGLQENILRAKRIKTERSFYL